jgi:putative restriction endonuclease
MPTERTWQQWLERLYNLRRDKRGDHERPHKPTLLLAILDLIDKGQIKANEVPFNDSLITTFRRHFEIVRRHDDKPTIENPFYFLAGDGFWNLYDTDNRALYQQGNASSPPSIGVLKKSLGRFNPALWALLQDPASRSQLRAAIISRYFPDHRAQLTLNSQPSTLNRSEAPQLNETFEQARSAAFRHTVLEIYDFMCAACGLRVRLDEDFPLIDAAHLIPFNESANDNPSNGLALCPNHHRAMDRFLIAPCPDPQHRAGIWRVHPRLDDRLDSRRDLIGLSGRPVMKPSEEKFFPAPESLRWREQHLTTKY